MGRAWKNGLLKGVSADGQWMRRIAAWDNYAATCCLFWLIAIPKNMLQLWLQSFRL